MKMIAIHRPGMKVVHAADGTNRPLCGALSMSPQLFVPIDAPVTCQSCRVALDGMPDLIMINTGW